MLQELAEVTKLSNTDVIIGASIWAGSNGAVVIYEKLAHRRAERKARETAKVSVPRSRSWTLLRTRPSLNAPIDNLQHR